MEWNLKNYLVYKFIIIDKQRNIKQKIKIWSNYFTI